MIYHSSRNCECDASLSSLETYDISGCTAFHRVALVRTPLSDKSKLGTYRKPWRIIQFLCYITVMTYFEYSQRNLLIMAKVKAGIGQIRTSRRGNMARNGVEHGDKLILSLRLHITRRIERPENAG
jgi:hypothetical protein